MRDSANVEPEPRWILSSPQVQAAQEHRSLSREHDDGERHDVPQLVPYGRYWEAFTVNHSLTLRYEGIKRKLTRSDARHG